ncbi:hypothetical protein ACP3XL_00360 [Vibrio anguillarum]
MKKKNSYYKMILRLIKNINAQDKEAAIEKAKYEEAKQFNNDNIVSSFFDVL